MKKKDERKIEKIKDGIRITRTIVEEFVGDDAKKLVSDIDRQILNMKNQLNSMKDQMKQFKKLIPDIEKEIKKLEEDYEKVKRLTGVVEVKKVVLNESK